MTEKEVIKCCKGAVEIHRKEFREDVKATDFYITTIKLIEEVQQYRLIGMVEECREAMKKQKAKKPYVNEYYYFCPNCDTRRGIRQKHIFLS